MKQSKIHIEAAERPVREFRTGVSLHSHTLHSKETLAFISSIAEQSGLCRLALDRGKTSYSRKNGVPLDLSRGWWTPPLAPFNAWTVERQAIEKKLGTPALVSLTDHDDIEAALSLRVLEPCQDLPISVEWTVPFGPTFFHIGVHNIAPERARQTMEQLSAFTSSRRTADLEDILRALASRRETLIVFNHPCWDEQVIGKDAHRKYLVQFIHNYGRYLHAFELNGLRPWPENRQVVQLAYEFDKPVISGGDRHALEPNATLDITDAATFSEFVDEVRAGYTNVLITKHYGEPFSLRILQSLQDILAYREDHGRGWKNWSDRVFFQCHDGRVHSLTSLFSNGMPAQIHLFVSAVQWTRNSRVRQTFRLAFPKRQEVAL